MLTRDEPDYKRVFLAVFLSAIVLISWQVTVEWPRRQALSKLALEVTEKRAQEKVKHAEQGLSKNVIDSEDNSSLTREQRIAATPRLSIVSEKLSGSIALKGARFDDLTLTKHRETIEPNSPGVVLLSPNGDEKGFFAQTGWVSADNKTKVPDQNSIWQADKKELKAGETVNLHWKNSDNVTFILSVTLDQDYMFSIVQKVENHSGHEISIMPYGYINRTYTMPETTAFLHEGPLGAMDGTLNEVGYQELKEKGNKTYESTNGWLGITDHYWLTALIPAAEHTKITYSHYSKNARERYQVDYLSDARTIASGASTENTTRLFSGAKEMQLVDRYTKGDPANHITAIPLFDRSLDLGSFYFLAKPMCEVVDYLYHATGNFGIALLIFIIIVKMLMFPLANKSYISMSQMRDLQPEMVKIRERYVDDQIGMHKATRELYKREKVNPASGCLPILIQVIVFLALFRGLNVAIELRHAPFYGWLQDLSAPDPSNLFTLFSLIPWETPRWLHLGFLPILYCVTMIIQTAQQPTPPDPVQAKMMKFMPYMMLFLFDSMASGFVLYWTWSNILSIMQQHVITKRHAAKKAAKAAAAAQP